MVVSYYSFWLVPQEPDLTYFQDLINGLAERFKTEPFYPHVTLYSGSLPASLAVTAVVKGLSLTQPIELEVITLNYETHFSKTLYVQLKQTVDFTQLVRDLVTAIPDAPQPRLDPHLSLLYHRLDAVTQQTLTETITLPRSTIQFDQIQVIAAPQNFETQSHVASLRCVHSKLLTLS